MDEVKCVQMLDAHGALNEMPGYPPLVQPLTCPLRDFEEGPPSSCAEREYHAQRGRVTPRDEGVQQWQNIRVWPC